MGGRGKSPLFQRKTLYFENSPEHFLGTHQQTTKHHRHIDNFCTEKNKLCYKNFVFSLEQIKLPKVHIVFLTKKRIYLYH